METSIPLIDFSPAFSEDPKDRRGLAAEIGQALETVGFFHITGHGVDPALVQQMRDEAYAFFALPIDEKMKVGRPAPEITRGYDPPARQSLSATRDGATPPDLQEGFGMGGFAYPPDENYFNGGLGHYFFAPNLWPERPAGLRTVLEEYHTRLTGLATQMMRIFALALDLDESYFDTKIDRTGAHMRLNKYPAQDTPPKPGQLRSGAHTDYGTLTILYGEDTPGGLQVMGNDGEWADVHPAKDSFIVNIGDSMARWTNDRWISTLHRVVNPPREHAAAERLSVAYFHATNYDAEIKCLESCLAPGENSKYEPTFYAAYYIDKLMKSRQTAES
jgi:isopenicillin N synthase-like dioxygenase